jgi:hypothetical protein
MKADWLGLVMTIVLAFILTALAWGVVIVVGDYVRGGKPWPVSKEK